MKINKLVLIIPILLGCGKEELSVKEFPVIKTHDVYNIDSSGATFKAEIIQNGKYPITSYGFIWDVDEINVNTSAIIQIDGEFDSKTVEVIIDTALVNGLEYTVMAFAKYNNNKVFGNKVKFISQGSDKSPWKLIEESLNLNYDGKFYSSSNESKTFFLSQNTDFYSYNHQNGELISLSNFPVSKSNIGNNKFTMISEESELYVFNNVDDNLYKFKNDRWEIESKLPFTYDDYYGYYHSFFYSQELFILSSKYSYSFNFLSKTWREINNFPPHFYKPVVGTTFNDKAYLLANDNKVWQYNIQSDTYLELTTFDDVIIEDNIFSFSYSNVIYYGIFNNNVENTNRIKPNFYSYNLINNEWIEVESFPKILNPGYSFYFTLNDMLYIGYKEYNSALSSIWEFDPQKYSY